VILADEIDAVAKDALYVYGVIRAGALRSIDAEGVAGAEVELVERDGLAAVVSPLPNVDLRVKRSDLHRHLHVIEAAFANTTILPCPFGTVVASQDELREGLLGAARRDLLAGIEQLNGTVQMNVKAVYEEDALLREIVATSPQIARLRERTRRSGNAGYYERLQLGELVAARVADHRERDAERLVGGLAKSAVDVYVEEPEEGCALKASFLVRRERLDRFETTLEETSRKEQPLLLFEAIGPLPPTAFAAAYSNP
jgi:Gas vesicle synthesis protein GvpL/GvpF